MVDALHIVRGGRTEVAVDSQGSIAQIKDNQTGRIYFNATETDRRLFHLVVPSPTWRSRPVMSHDCGSPVVEKTASGLVLQYGELHVERQDSGICAKVEITPSARGDEVQLSLQLSNQGPHTITSVIFPWLSGWQSPGNPAKDVLLPGLFKKLTLNDFPHWFLAWGNGAHGQEHAHEYSSLAGVPWIDFSGEQGGVGLINYQREPRQCFACVKNMAGHDAGHRMAMFWGFFFAFVPPGGHWASPTMGVSVHDGDWHRTADRYRQWISTWLKPADAPWSFRESIGSEHVVFNSFDGSPIRQYEQLPHVASYAREHGVREICVWDRMSLGTYAGNSPDEDLLGYSPRDRQRLSQAVHRAAADGSEVSALINFRLANPSMNAFHQEGLEDEMQRNLDGTPRVENSAVARIPGHFVTPYYGPSCHIFSSFSEKYQQRVLRKIDEYIDLGYTSLFYDQPFEQGADYGRIDRGCMPEMTYAALVDLLRQVRTKMREKHPHALIFGECCDIHASQFIDQWMHWYWSNYDFDWAVRVHYAMPHTVVHCVVDREIGLASRAFAAGLHLLVMTRGGEGTLADVPAFAEHIRKLSALRRRCADRTVHARFNDVQGLTLDTSSGLIAYSYDSRSGPAVIVAAPDKTGAATIAVDRSAFSHPGHPAQGRLYFLDGNDQHTDGDTITLDLKQYDVAVWVL
ncbi:MAG: hypothetical protein IT440_11430 [Phycisphaeraceae bacterium]|nr:hypothetical protein [Phycisphaeraceae bacterium]